MSDPAAIQADGRAGVVLDPSPGRAEFARRVWMVAGVTVLTLAFLAAMVRAGDVFFLTFLAILFSILFNAAADWLAAKTGLPRSLALVVVLLVVAGLLGGGGYAVGASVAAQVEQLESALPDSIGRLREYLGRSPWGRWAVNHAPRPDELIFGGRGSVAVASFFTTTLGAVGNLIVLGVLTVYFAANPGKYVSGLLTLVPTRHRDRAGRVVSAVGYHLRWWLVGRLVAMVVVGLVVGVGLWFVGVPQFLVLGLLATALNAIPYLGPFVAAVPGLLLALMQGPTAFLWAAGVYTLAQVIDNYLVTPLVQQRTVEMPPVLSILSVVLAGALFGVLGVIAAAPLAVVALVAVKMLYVEDALGDRLDVSGAHPPAVTAV